MPKPDERATSDLDQSFNRGMQAKQVSLLYI